MELKTTVLGAAIGGVIGAIRGEDLLKYALWGGGIGLGVSLLRSQDEGGFRVGDLAFSLPTPAQPGQVVYNLDPRRDPLLDPVSRRQLYPTWLLMHWQNGDPKIIAQIQGLLGVAQDGVVGSGTSAAIHVFQAHNGLPVTGTMDRMTMEALVST